MVANQDNPELYIGKGYSFPDEQTLIKHSFAGCATSYWPVPNDYGQRPFHRN